MVSRREIEPKPYIPEFVIDGKCMIDAVNRPDQVCLLTAPCTECPFNGYSGEKAKDLSRVDLQRFYMMGVLKLDDLSQADRELQQKRLLYYDLST